MISSDWWSDCVIGRCRPRRRGAAADRPQRPAAPALIERTRAGGMVVGREGETPLRMDFVSNLADVKQGDVVATSGADGIYPKGFRIGWVERADRGDGLSLAITVRPSVDFRALDEVLVVLREARGVESEGAPPGGQDDETVRFCFAVRGARGADRLRELIGGAGRSLLLWPWCPRAGVRPCTACFLNRRGSGAGYLQAASSASSSCDYARGLPSRSARRAVPRLGSAPRFLCSCRPRPEGCVQGLSPG